MRTTPKFKIGSFSILLSTLLGPVAFAAENVGVTVTPSGAANAAAPVTPSTAPDPVKTCEAYLSTVEPVKPKKKRGPVRLVAKALTSELGTDSSDMLKDAIFVFSAKDVDPYARKPPTNKPYTFLEFQMIDGSQASLIKYPDESCKVVGGFADGTIIAPSGANTFIVAYPNGARGKMVKIGSEYKIYRPDNTITTIKKEMSGEYQMSNSKIGYMGTAEPDREGMQFEMGSQDF